jgi:hypothetical protein
VIVLLARAVGSAALVAVTVTLAKPGNGAGGAVYLPVASIVPTALGVTPAGGVNDQVTAVFIVPATVALNCRTPSTGTVRLAAGSRVTVTTPAETIFAVSVVTIRVTKPANICKDIPPILLRIWGAAMKKA